MWISPLFLNSEVQKVSLLLAFVQCHTKNCCWALMGYFHLLQCCTSVVKMSYSYLYHFSEIIWAESHEWNITQLCDCTHNHTNFEVARPQSIGSG